VYSRRLAHTQEVPPAKDLSLFPSRINQWIGRDYNFDPNVLELLGTDNLLNRAYVNHKGDSISLYVGYYRSQKTGDQIHSPLHCYPGTGWNPISRKVVPVHLQDRVIHINRMLIQNGSERQMVAYWYQSQNKAIATEYMQRLNLIINALRKNRTDGSLIRISTTIAGDDPEGYWKTMTDFIKETYPFLIEYLPQ
jgi:EpsI family protein